MLIDLIVIGELKERAYQERCLEYQRRLRAYGKIEIKVLPDSSPEREAEKILKYLERENNAEIIVLSEEGKEFTTADFARKIGGINRKLLFVIGGPFGLSSAVKQRADWLWSLSKLTFTHEMARLICCEQIYRAANILHGGHYHH